MKRMIGILVLGTVGCASLDEYVAPAETVDAPAGDAAGDTSVLDGPAADSRGDSTAPDTASDGRDVGPDSTSGDSADAGDALADTRDSGGSDVVDSAVDSTVDTTSTIDSGVDTAAPPDTATTPDTVVAVDTAPVCAAGSYACNGAGSNVLQQCAPDGSGFTDVVTCPSAATCSPGAGRCTACIPGEVTCAGAQLMKCDAMGVAPAPFGAACPSGATCDATGGGKCVVCAAGTTFCTGAELFQCSADGTSSSSLGVCANTTICASSGPGGCGSPTCTAGQTKCVGTQYLTCNATLTGFDVTATCATAALCSTTAIPAGCQPPQCTPGLQRCTGNVLEVCNADQTAFVTKDTCLSAALCTTSGCLACTAGSVRCNGATPQTCAADGSAWVDGTACVAPETCGGGGSAGVCGCTPLSVSAACGAATCGTAADGCGGTVSCGGCGGKCTAGVCATVVEVSAGQAHACARLGDGSVWCWGDNSQGSIGDGTVIQRPAPTRVPGVTATSISAGRYHTCAILADKTVRCWGRNFEGQLGDGLRRTYENTPVAVTGLTNVDQITAGGLGTCALVGGIPYCWGDDSSGQVGDGSSGTLLARTSPTPVTTTGGSTLSAIRSIARGRDHVCAIGSVAYCWGANSYSQVGDGSVTMRTNPVLASFAYEAYIGAGPYSDASCQIFSASGNLQCWGKDPLGGASVSRPTDTGIANVASVTIGYDHRCIILKDGTTECWGSNSAGQVGDGTSINRPAPVLVTLPSANQVVAGYQFTCAVSGAFASCWGINGNGQLGDGTVANHSSPAPVTFP